MDGLLAANDRMREDGLDAVLKAAATAFGFVYIHPFQDGNGRMHRCLIHHVLAERKFTPPGMVFPVSSVMLDRIEDYRTILQSHSGALMPYIDWRPTLVRNVEVLNDTADLYRYYDATAAAEFLYAGVRSSGICRARSIIWPVMTRRCAGLWKPSKCRTAPPKTLSCLSGRTTAPSRRSAGRANSRR
jgi:hypothetical protein